MIINELPLEDNVIKVVDEFSEFFVLIEKLMKLPQEVSMLVTEKFHLMVIDLKKLLLEPCQVVGQVLVLNEDACFGLLAE